jgi:hypothetical protein
MPFRVTGHDLTTGRPSPPYESRAANEAEAHEEADRLGIRIESIQPIASLAARDQANEVGLADWHWPALAWRTRRWALIRLGFEHPRWGKLLKTVALIAAALGRSKLVPILLKFLIGAGLAATGLRGDPEDLATMIALAVLLLPLLALKPFVFWRLCRAHAPDGFDRERRLRVKAGVAHWFDGRRQRVLAAGQVIDVHELDHSVLVRLSHADEFAIPIEVLGTRVQAHHFAERFAAMHVVELHVSRWSAPKPDNGMGAWAIRWFAILLLVVVLILLVTSIGDLLSD